MRIAMKVVGHDKAKYFERIPAHGTFLKPGDKAVMRADGYPIIISTSRRYLMVAHAERADAVNVLIHTLETQGVSLSDIRMSIQMFRQGIESAFIDQAVRAGLRHVWAAFSIDEFLALTEKSAKEKNYILLRRRD